MTHYDESLLFYFTCIANFAILYNEYYFCRNIYIFIILLNHVTLLYSIFASYLYIILLVSMYTSLIYKDIRKCICEIE